MKQAFTIVFLSFCLLKLYGQNLCWRSESSFEDVEGFAETKEHIWASTQGGILKYNKQTKKLENTYHVLNSKLTQSPFNRFFVDKKGDLWVASVDQIFKYINNSFVKINEIQRTPNATSEGKHYISDFLVTESGEIWATCGYDGIFYFDGKIWKNYNSENSNLPPGLIRGITSNYKGDFWLAAFDYYNEKDGGVVHFNLVNGQIKPKFFSTDGASEVEYAEDGKVWYKTTRYVGFIEQDKVTHFPRKDFFKDNVIRDFAVMGSKCYISTYYGFFYEYNNGAWVESSLQYTLEKFIPIQNGEFWGEVETWNGGVIYSITANHSFISLEKTSLSEVGSPSGIVEINNDLYLSSSSALTKYTEEGLKTWPAPAEGIPTLLADQSILLVNRLGRSLRVRRYFSNDSFKDYNLNVPSNEIYRVKHVKNEGDTVWIFSTFDVCCFVPKTEKLFQYTKHKFVCDYYHQTFLDDKKNMWMQVKDTIFFNGFKQSSFSFNFKELLGIRNRGNLRGMGLDKEQNPWIVSDFEIYKFERGSWIFKYSLPVNYFFCSDPFNLAFDSDNKLWLGRRDQLWRMGEKGWEDVKIAKDQGYYDQWVYDIIPLQSKNEIVLLHESGFFLLDPACYFNKATTSTSNISSPTGQMSEILVSPNPSTPSDRIKVRFNLALNSNAWLRVFNNLGQEVFKKPVSENTNECYLDVSLPRGAYWVNVTNSNQTMSTKFIKN